MNISPKPWIITTARSFLHSVPHTLLLVDLCISDKRLKCSHDDKGIIYFVSGSGNVLKHAQFNLAKYPFCPADSGGSRTQHLTLTFYLAASLYLNEVYGSWILVLWNKSFLFKCQYLIRHLHWSILMFPLLSSEMKCLTATAVLTVNSLKNISL